MLINDMTVDLQSLKEINDIISNENKKVKDELE